MSHSVVSDRNRRRRLPTFAWDCVSYFWDVFMDPQLILVSKLFYRLFIRQCNVRFKITPTAQNLHKIMSMAHLLPAKGLSLNLTHLDYTCPVEFRSLIYALGPRTSAAWLSPVIPKPLLYALMSSVKNIEVLNLRGVQAVDDKSLMMLEPQNLRKISLRGCWRVSDRGLIYLLQNAPNLSHILLSGCSKLTARSLHAISKLNGLQSLDFPWNRVGEPGQAPSLLAAQVGSQFAQNCSALRTVKFSLPCKLRLCDIHAFTSQFAESVAIDAQSKAQERRRGGELQRHIAQKSQQHNSVAPSALTTIEFNCEGPETPNTAKLVNTGKYVVPRHDTEGAWDIVRSLRMRTAIPASC